MALALVGAALAISAAANDNSQGRVKVRRLDAASLAATVQMRELGTADSAPYTMDIQLQWTGIGEPSKAREHIMLDYPGFRVNSRESGTTRAADVTGVVSDGTTNYVSGAWAGGTLNSPPARWSSSTKAAVPVDGAGAILTTGAPASTRPLGRVVEQT